MTCVTLETSSSAGETLEATRGVVMFMWGLSSVEQLVDASLRLG
jgi:hypothetical protein